MSEFINPYNFIPLKGSPKRENRRESDNQEKFTGVIEYSVLSKTRLFIPNTSNSKVFQFNIPMNDVDGCNNDEKKSKIKEIKEKHKTYDFYSYTDLSNVKGDCSKNFQAPIIPGSEIRGMLRSYYEVLTNSCLSVMEEDAILSRRMIETFEPGLIKKEGDGKFSLYKAKDYLWRTKGTNNRKDELNWQGSYYKRKCYKQDAEDLKEGHKVYFEKGKRPTEKPGEKPKGKPLAKNVSGKKDNDNDNQLEGYIIKGEDGPVLKSKGEKHCAHIFKPIEKLKSSNVDISVLKLALNEYKKYSEQGDDKKQNYAYKEYAEQLEIFEKDKEWEFFPVYYNIIENSPNYVMLSPACITREIYQNNMKKLAGKFCSCDDKEKLCPACSLFGTVQKDFAYSSKIRFTDLECKSKIENEEEVIINKGNVENCYDKIITLPEMSSPKITSTEFYMKRPNNGAVFWTWDYYISANGKVIPLEKPELNGRKFYWHNLKDNIPENIPKTIRNITVRPLKKNVKFTGKLYFKNITGDELMSLYWLLNCGENGGLEDKKHGYKLGSAKPLGFGSIAINVDNVFLRKVNMADNTIKIKEEPIKEELDQNKDVWRERFFRSINRTRTRDIISDFNEMTKFNIFSETGTEKDIIYPRIENQTNGTEGFQWFVNNRYICDKENKKKSPSPGKDKRNKLHFKEYMQPIQADLKFTTGQSQRRN